MHRKKMDASGTTHKTESCAWPGQYNILHMDSTPLEVRLRESEQTTGVGDAAAGHAVEIHAAQFSHPRCNGRHEGRLIALAAAGHRSQKRAIGFHQKTILRHLTGAVVGGLRLGKVTVPLKLM